MEICKRATWLMQYVPNTNAQQQQTCSSTATYIANQLLSKVLSLKSRPAAHEILTLLPGWCSMRPTPTPSSSRPSALLPATIPTSRAGPPSTAGPPPRYAQPAAYISLTLPSLATAVWGII